MHRKNGTSKNAENSIILLMEIVITLIPILLFFYTYTHHYPAATFYSKGNLLFFVMYAAILMLFMSIYGAQKLRKYRTRELVFAFALSSFFTDVIMYFVMCLIAQRLLNPGYVILTMVLQWIIELILYVIGRILIDKLGIGRRVLYIADDACEQSVESKFDRRRTSYILSERMDTGRPEEELFAAMDNFKTVFFGDMDEGLRGRLMDHCFRNGITVLVKPGMRDIMIGCGETVMMSDLMLFELHTGESERGYVIAKRALDIVASLVGLILCSPILIATAIAIKSQDGGPVFYRQKRLTKNGKPFMLTKFRSMVVNAESATGAVLAGKSDSRITKVGRFIRATRIDELPQLLNILSGEMTLVGPRPERPEFYEKYCAEYPEFAYRLQVKAGLTGYAQLYGKYNTTFIDKARMDMYYIQKASFLRDIQLIFYTLKIIFVKDSTEGVDSEKSASEKAKEETTV